MSELTECSAMSIDGCDLKRRNEKQGGGGLGLFSIVNKIQEKV